MLKDLLKVEVKECPLCGATEFRLRARASQKIGEETVTMTYFMCKCGMVFMSPRPDYEAYYSSGEYRAQTIPDEAALQRTLGMEIQRAHHQADWLNQFESLPQVGERHLDIGCSSGALLQVFSFRFGTKSAGVEPDPKTRAIAQAAGFPVWDSNDKIDGTFDFITLSHVLEHQTAPAEFIKGICKKYLKAGGRLMIEVPNVTGPHAFRFPHPVAFSEQTLRLTVGLQEIASTRHAIPNIIPDCFLLGLWSKNYHEDA